MARGSRRRKRGWKPPPEGGSRWTRRSGTSRGETRGTGEPSRRRRRRRPPPQPLPLLVLGPALSSGESRLRSGERREKGDETLFVAGDDEERERGKALFPTTASEMAIRGVNCKGYSQLTSDLSTHCYK
jgi:hypothetical protein